MSPDELNSLGQNVGEGGPVHDGVPPLAILNDIVGQVEEIEPVRRVR